LVKTAHSIKAMSELLPVSRLYSTLLIWTGAWLLCAWFVWSAVECRRRGNQPVPLSLRACVRTEYTGGRHFKRLLR